MKYIFPVFMAIIAIAAWLNVFVHIWNGYKLEKKWGRGMYYEAKEAWEKSFLIQHLKEHNGNVSDVARDVNLCRSHVNKLIKKHGLKVENYK